MIHRAARTALLSAKAKAGAKARYGHEQQHNAGPGGDREHRIEDGERSHRTQAGSRRHGAHVCATLVRNPMMDYPDRQADSGRYRSLSIRPHVLGPANQARRPGRIFVITEENRSFQEKLCR